MATQFNIVAQLSLRGPTNMAAIQRRIQAGLRNIRADVQVNIGRGAQRGLRRTNQQLQQIATSLATVTANAGSAAAALGQVGAALNTAGAGGAATARGANQTAAGMRNVAGASAEAAFSMREFGRISASAVRRFLAFSIPAGIVVGLIVGIKSGVKAAIAFERQLIKVAQVTGKTTESLTGLTDEITRLSTTFGVASADLLEVSRILAQTGLSARDTEIALAALAKSELAPTFDSMAQTAEAAIAAMRQFKIGAEDLESTMGAINAVASQFAVESGDIGSALRKTGGAFKAAGGSINELIALFTSVRATTRESADSIATGFRTIFTRIQRPKTIEFMRELGVELQTLDGKFVGPFETIRRLNTVLKDLDPRDVRFSQIVEQLGGFRQVSKVIPLIQQFDTAQQALAVSLSGAGSLAEDAATAQQALAVRIAKVGEQFQALFRRLTGSRTFEVIARSLLNMASGFAKVFETLEPVLPMLTALAGLRLASIGAQFGAGFIGDFRGAAQAGPGTPGGQQQQQRQSTLMTANSAALDALTTIIRGPLITAVNRLTQRLALANPGPQRRPSRGGRIHAFAGGGMVPGVGSGDTVPAMLEPGEFVIRKKAVETIGHDNLADINRKTAGDRATDTVSALLTPGEFVINKRSADAIGLNTLTKMNRADRNATGGIVQGFADGGSVQKFQTGGAAAQGGGVGSLGAIFAVTAIAGVAQSMVDLESATGKTIQSISQLAITVGSLQLLFSGLLPAIGRLGGVAGQSPIRGGVRDASRNLFGGGLPGKRGQRSTAVKLRTFNTALAQNERAMAGLTGVVALASAVLLIWGQSLKKQSLVAAKEAGKRGASLREAESQARTGGALSGAGIGAGAGALVGAFAGPIGIAVGAVLGGIVGALVGAFTANTKAVREAARAGRFEVISEQLGQSIKSITSGRRDIRSNALSDVASNIREQSDLMFDAFAEGSDKQAKEIKSNLKSQLSAFETLRQKLVETSAGIEDFKSAAGGAGRTLLIQISQATGRSFAELTKETREQIEAVHARRAADLAAAKAADRLADTARVMNTFAASMEELTQSVDKTVSSMQVFAGLALGKGGGAPKFKPSGPGFGGVLTGGITKNQFPAFQRALTQALGKGGVAQQQTARFETIAKLSRDLPDILRGIGNDPFVERSSFPDELRKRLQQEIAAPGTADEDLADDPAIRALRGVIETLVANVKKTEGGESGILAKTKTQALKLREEAFRGVATQEVKSLEKIAKGLTTAVNQFGALQQEIFKVEARIRDLRIKGSNQALNNEKILASVQKKRISLTKQLSVIDKQQQIRVEGTGVAPELANDAITLGTRIQEVNRQIQKAQQDLDSADTKEGIIAAQREYGELVNTSSRLRGALEHLATSTESLSAQQAEFQRLEAERQRKQGFVADYFFGSRKQQIDTLRTIVATQRAGEANSLDILSDKQKASVFGFLKSLGKDERPLVTQGRTSEEFIKDVIIGSTKEFANTPESGLLKEFLVKTALGPTTEQEKLIQAMQETTQKQSDAMGTLLATLGSQNNEFISGMTAANQALLAGFESDRERLIGGLGDANNKFLKDFSVAQLQASVDRTQAEANSLAADEKVFKSQQGAATEIQGRVAGVAGLPDDFTTGARSLGQAVNLLREVEKLRGTSDDLLQRKGHGPQTLQAEINKILTEIVKKTRTGATVERIGDRVTEGDQFKILSDTQQEKLITALTSVQKALLKERKLLGLFGAKRAGDFASQEQLLKVVLGAQNRSEQIKFQDPLESVVRADVGPGGIGRRDVQLRRDLVKIGGDLNDIFAGLRADSADSTKRFNAQLGELGIGVDQFHELLTIAGDEGIKDNLKRLADLKTADSINALGVEINKVNEEFSTVSVRLVDLEAKLEKATLAAAKFGGVATGPSTPSLETELSDIFGPGFASGGQLLRRGTDTVPTMLTPGEFVVNAGATRRNLSTLQSINHGVDYKADGGIIQYMQGGGQAQAAVADPAMGNEVIRLLGQIVVNTAPRSPAGFATGGSVFKPRGTDTVPAMLTPGEFVVNRKATRNNLSALQAINGGQTTYAAEGGVIPRRTPAAKLEKADVLTPDEKRWLESARAGEATIAKLRQKWVNFVLNTNDPPAVLRDYKTALGGPFRVPGADFPQAVENFNASLPPKLKSDGVKFKHGVLQDPDYIIGHDFPLLMEQKRVTDKELNPNRLIALWDNMVGVVDASGKRFDVQDAIDQVGPPSLAKQLRANKREAEELGLPTPMTREERLKQRRARLTRARRTRTLPTRLPLDQRKELVAENKARRGTGRKPLSPSAFLKAREDKAVRAKEAFAQAKEDVFAKKVAIWERRRVNEIPKQPGVDERDKQREALKERIEEFDKLRVEAKEALKGGDKVTAKTKGQQGKLVKKDIEEKTKTLAILENKIGKKEKSAREKWKTANPKPERNTVGFLTESLEKDTPQTEQYDKWTRDEFAKKPKLVQRRLQNMERFRKEATVAEYEKALVDTHLRENRGELSSAEIRKLENQSRTLKNRIEDRGKRVVNLRRVTGLPEKLEPVTAPGAAKKSLPFSFPMSAKRQRREKDSKQFSKSNTQYLALLKKARGLEKEGGPDNLNRATQLRAKAKKIIQTARNKTIDYQQYKSDQAAKEPMKTFKFDSRGNVLMKKQGDFHFKEAKEGVHIDSETEIYSDKDKKQLKPEFQNKAITVHPKGKLPVKPLERVTIEEFRAVRDAKNDAFNMWLAAMGDVRRTTTISQTGREISHPDFTEKFAKAEDLKLEYDVLSKNFMRLANRATNEFVAPLATNVIRPEAEITRFDIESAQQEAFAQAKLFRLRGQEAQATQSLRPEEALLQKKIALDEELQRSEWPLKEISAMTSGKDPLQQIISRNRELISRADADPNLMSSDEKFQLQTQTVEDGTLLIQRQGQLLRQERSRLGITTPFDSIEGGLLELQDVLSKRTAGARWDFDSVSDRLTKLKQAKDDFAKAIETRQSADDAREGRKAFADPRTKGYLTAAEARRDVPQDMQRAEDSNMLHSRAAEIRGQLDDDKSPIKPEDRLRLTAELDKINQQIKNLPKRKVATLAQGGIVPGFGSRDTVPAMLTPGELVIPKRQVQHMADGGIVQYRQTGGSVSQAATGVPTEIKLDIDTSALQAALSSHAEELSALGNIIEVLHFPLDSLIAALGKLSLDFAPLTALASLDLVTPVAAFGSHVGTFNGHVGGFGQYVLAFGENTVSFGTQVQTFGSQVVAFENAVNTSFAAQVTRLVDATGALSNIPETIALNVTHNDINVNVTGLDNFDGGNIEGSFVDGLVTRIKTEMKQEIRNWGTEGGN